MQLYLPNEETIVLVLLGLILFLSIMFILYAYNINTKIRKLKKRNKDLEFILNNNLESLLRSKDNLDSRFLYIKSIIDIIYKTCDNPPKFKEKIGSKFLEDKDKGLLINFFHDILYVTNKYTNGLIGHLKNEYLLTNKELRLCCFLYWGFSSTQICTIENITENSYYVKCFRIKAKLKLNKEDKILTFLKEFQLNLN